MITRILDRPFAVISCALVALVVGIASAVSIRLQEYPQPNSNKLSTVIPIPGMQSGDIQTRIGGAIEAPLTALKGARRVTSLATDGQLECSVEYHQGIDMDYAELEMVDALSGALSRQGWTSFRPRVTRYVPEELRRESFAEIAVSGPWAPDKLRHYAGDFIASRIRSVPGIAGVETIGGTNTQVEVRIRPDLLELLSLDAGAIDSQLLRETNLQTTGSVRFGGRTLQVVLNRAPPDLHELRAMRIDDGKLRDLRLETVADVRWVQGEGADVYRVNGLPTVGIRIVAEPNVDELRLSRRLREKLTSLASTIPHDLDVSVTSDDGKVIARDLHRSLGVSLTSLILLLGFVYAMTRSLLQALCMIVSVLIPVCLSLSALYLFGLTMNLISIAALGVSFGMLVDNAVVIVDGYTARRWRGASPGEAASSAMRALFLPLVASSAGMLGVFLPIMYFQGRLAIYYVPLVVTLAVTLAASLLTVSTVVPVMLAIGGRSEIGHSQFWQKARGAYVATLLSALRRRWIVLPAVVLIWGISFATFHARVPRGGFSLPGERDKVYVLLEPSPGTPLGHIDGVAMRFEEILRRMMPRIEFFTRLWKEFGMIEVTFQDKPLNYAFAEDVKTALSNEASGVAGIGVIVYGMDWNIYSSGVGGSMGRDSGVSLKGYDYQKLRQIAEQVRGLVAKNPLVSDPIILASSQGLDERARRLRLAYATTPLAALRETPENVSQQVNPLLRTEAALPLVSVGQRDYPLQVVPEGGQRLRSLLSWPIRRSDGAFFPMSHVVTADTVGTEGAISREDQVFRLIAAWTFHGSEKLRTAFEKAVFDGISLPVGFSKSLDQEWMMTEEETSALLQALVVSTGVLFIILAALYESLLMPLVVLLTLPLATTGVFWIYLCSDRVFDASAMVSLILLGGIVANNGILMVDRLMHLRGEWSSSELANAAAERLRPILLTGGAALLALLPAVLWRGDSAAQQDIWGVLSFTTMGGLGTAVLLSLMVVPLLCRILGPRIVERRA